MSRLAFRNVDAHPDDPVENWPYEGLVTAIERGSRSDWQRIADAIRRSPWGIVARDVGTYAAYGDERAVAALLVETVRRAQGKAEAGERRTVADRINEAITISGLTAQQFAAEIGTSASRLSTYRSGRVQPSAAMLIRIEGRASDLSSGPATHPPMPGSRISSTG